MPKGDQSTRKIILTTIYLVRHGQASFNADNYDKLSDKGIVQAQVLGEALSRKMYKPDKVVTGTMFRHLETAEHSLLAFDKAERQDFIQHEDANWNELDHQAILGIYQKEFSTAKGVRSYLETKENAKEGFQKIFLGAITQWMNTENNKHYPESFQEFTSRVLKALNQLLESENNSENNIVIYSSGGPISIIISHLLNIPFSEFIRINMSLVNGGITKIVTPKPEGLRKFFPLVLSTLNEHSFYEERQKDNLITYI